MECIEYKQEYQESLEKFLDTMYEVMEYRFTHEKKQYDLKNTCQLCIRSGGGFWLIVKDEDVIGTIGLKVIDSINEIGEIKRLFVLPKYQGNGYGQKLLLKAISSAKEYGLSYLKLYTTFKSQKAISLYKNAASMRCLVTRTVKLHRSLWNLKSSSLDRKNETECSQLLR